MQVRLYRSLREVRDLSTSVPTPIRPSERNQTLDVLRGFAILGILLVNIALFRGGFWPQLIGDDPWTGRVDQAVAVGTSWLADWKFLSAFAFMFGLGAAMQLARGWARGDQTAGVLPRRFGILALIGLLHGLLIWPGDVLLLYAVLGSILLLFRHARVNTLLWGAAGIAGGLFLITLIFSAFIASQSSSAGFASDESGTAFLAPIAERAFDVYAHGGYLDQVGFRLVEFPLTQVGSVLAAPMVFMLFLLGFAAGKAGIVTDTARFEPLLRRVRRWGLAIGLPLNLFAAGPGGTGGVLQLAEVSLIYIAPPILSLGYLAALTLACRNADVLRRLSALASVGRMALSAYLFTSVVCTAFFSVTGLYGSASPSMSLAVVAVVWALLLVICPWWLRRFRMGPVEWVWRSLTYRARQPFRHTPAQDPERLRRGSRDL